MQPSSDSMHKVLQELASQYDERTQQVQIFDSNVTPYNVTDEYKLDAPPGTVFTRSLKFALHGNTFEAETSDYYFALHLKPKEYNGPVFSVNRADRMVLGSDSIEHSHIGELPVFTSADVDQALDDALRSPTIQSLIGALELAPEESLHCFGNGATLYLGSATVHRIEAVALILTQLIATLDKGPTEQILLPEPFRHLQKLAEMWGVNDDEDREALIASASRKSLEALYDAVSPLFNDINRYLDSSAAEDEPEPAALLGRLAEAATEAGNAL